MFGIKRQVIAKHERGMYLKDRSIEKILEPGVYWIADVPGRVKVEVYDITRAAPYTGSCSSRCVPPSVPAPSIPCWVTRVNWTVWSLRPSVTK